MRSSLWALLNPNKERERQQSFFVHFYGGTHHHKQIMINQWLHLKQCTSLVDTIATPDSVLSEIITSALCLYGLCVCLGFSGFVNMCVCMPIEYVKVLDCFQHRTALTICTHSIRGTRTDVFPHRDTTQAGVLAVVSRSARTASTPIRLACMWDAQIKLHLPHSSFPCQHILPLLRVSFVLLSFIYFKSKLKYPSFFCFHL